MELTRRDALAALGGAVAVGGGTTALTWRSLRPDRAFDAHEVATLEAAAAVLYPSDVSGVSDFLETYVVARTSERPGRASGMREALAAVDARSQSWFDAAFRDLATEDRAAVFDQMGLDVRVSDPDGLLEERVRYYLVNELLYAFYATPKGAELVGLSNPQGYPGGTASYQRGPDDA